MQQGRLLRGALRLQRLRCRWRLMACQTGRRTGRSLTQLDGVTRPLTPMNAAHGASRCVTAARGARCDAAARPSSYQSPSVPAARGLRVMVMTAFLVATTAAAPFSIRCRGRTAPPALATPHGGGRQRPPPRCTRRALLLIALSTAPLHRAAAARAQPQQAPIDAQADEPPFTHQVFLDFELSDARPARVQIALYGTVVPQTVHNFLSLVDSHQYDGTSVYRIVPGLTVQLGDVLRNKGKSGRASTSSGSLPAENFNISHSAPGIVSMVVKDGMVDSRFFITTRPGDSRYLDGKYVAFARVVDGMDVLYRMEKLYARPGAIIQKPLSVRILRCARVEPQQ